MSDRALGPRSAMSDLRDAVLSATLDTERSGKKPALPSRSARALALSADAPWRDILKLAKHWTRAGDAPEFHPREHQIVLRLKPSGTVEMRLAGERARRLVCHPGDFCLFSQGLPIRSWHDREAEFLALAIAPSFVTAVADQTATDGHRVEFTNPCSVRDPSVRHIILALESELAAGCPAGRLYGEGLATALAVHLLRRYAVFPAKTVPCRGGLPSARLRRVLDHVEAHLGDDISLRQLADLAQLSPNHFATLFKKSTGLPPHQHLLRRRIERAKELLANERLSLAEIGYSLGFPSQAHFTTMFRKLVGTTPGAYRAGR